MSSGNDLRPQEWSQARATVQSVDTTLTDLRKYGLSFVAGLLTAQGLTEVAGSPTSSYVPYSVKLAIIVVSLLLILAMVAIERVNRAVQRAAAYRARSLERHLGMELTDDIANFYEAYSVLDWIDFLYLLFIVATGALGLAILNAGAWSWNWATICDIVATGAALGMVFVIGPRRKDEVIDWTLDRYRCNQGDRLTILATNFSSLTVKASAGDAVWSVEGLPEDKGKKGVWRNDDQGIPPNGTRVWILTTGDLEPGVYPFRIMVRVGKIPRGAKELKLDHDVTLPRPLVVDPETVAA